MPTRSKFGDRRSDYREAYRGYVRMLSQHPNKMLTVDPVPERLEMQQRCAAILDCVNAGAMPCDGAWPKERVEAFDTQDKQPVFAARTAASNAAHAIRFTSRW